MKGALHHEFIHINIDIQYLYLDNYGKITWTFISHNLTILLSSEEVGLYDGVEQGYKKNYYSTVEHKII